MHDLKAFRKNVWYLVGATRGGPMRIRIIYELMDRPLNANQLTKKLGVDYKTVRHHLEVLKKNNWITMGEENYGSLFFPAFTEEQKQVFEEVFLKIGKKF